MSEFIEPIAHRKIAAEFELFAEQFIKEITVISSLFESYNDKSSNPKVVLHRTIVRMMIENLVSEKPLTPEQFINDRVVTEQAPITIKTCKFYDWMILEFFRSVVSDGGFVEIAGDIKIGSRWGALSNIPIDIMNSDASCPQTRYFVYIKRDDTFIRVDLLCSDDNSYLSVNRMMYPSISNNKDILFMGIIDIAEKKIRSVLNLSLVMQLVEASGLFDKGYRFENDGRLQRMFCAYLREIRIEKYVMYLDDDKISQPSGEPRDNRMIVMTEHEPEFITMDMIMSHKRVMRMLTETTLPFKMWHLPETGDGYGTTFDTVTVFKGAKCRMFTHEFSHNDIFSEDVHEFVVMVELEIPKFTRFYRCMDEYLKFRFEKAIVKRIYSYPKRPIDESTMMVYSDYDRDFKYVVGETITPTLPYEMNSTYEMNSNNPYATGIHAFLDVDTVWSYFLSSPKLFDYQKSEITISVMTTTIE